MKDLSNAEILVPCSSCKELTNDRMSRADPTSWVTL